MRFSSSTVAAAMLAALFAVGGAGSLRADEALRRIQQSLRDQGFYYGPIDGAPGDETTQAIRRYQIRNGLAVTGALNDETRNAIAKTGGGNTGGSTPRAVVTPTPVPTARGRATPSYEPDYRIAPREAAQPPATIRGNSDDNRSPANGDEDEETTTTTPPDAPAYRGGDPAAPGRPDLRVAPPPGDENGSSNPPPSRNEATPSPSLSALFERTPYELAPPAVQSDIVRRAQSQLLRNGFYDGATDGIPGPQTAEAIANFQEVNRLRRTGRLDVNTLATLRLLPARRVTGPRYYAPRYYYGPRPGGVYEGRIVPGY